MVQELGVPIWMLAELAVESPLFVDPLFFIQDLVVACEWCKSWLLRHPCLLFLCAGCKTLWMHVDASGSG